MPRGVRGISEDKRRKPQIAQSARKKPGEKAIRALVD
jgi:hypothetical protein